MIAKGTMHLVLLPVLMQAVVAFFLVFLTHPLLSLVSLLLTLLFLFLLFFFRDPKRIVGEGIVSPADGRILWVDKSKNELSIYMSLSSVHVNRAPLSGRVVRMEHYPGSHLPAFTKGSTKNERLETTFETSIGEVKVTQISGAIARRILPYIEEGDQVARGQRIGIVLFGSRVELLLPKKARFLVDRGLKVRAAETKIAEVYDVLD